MGLAAYQAQQTRAKEDQEKELRYQEYLAKKEKIEELKRLKEVEAERNGQAMRMA